MRQKLFEILQFFGTLLTEDRNGKTILSLGRVTLVAVLGFYFWIWSADIVGEEEILIPPGLSEVFLVLCGYVFGSKVLNTWRPGVPSAEKEEKEAP